MIAIEEITRRLKGRHLATIDNVVGIPGRAPAIVITWSDGVGDGTNEFYYDNGRDYFEVLTDARNLAANYPKTHDVRDNTL